MNKKVGTLDVPHDRGGTPSLLMKFSFPDLIEQCDLQHVTWKAEHSSLKSVQVCHTPWSSTVALPTSGVPHDLEIASIIPT